MAAHRITFDGLWKCLCPSFRPIDLQLPALLPQRHALATRQHASLQCQRAGDQQTLLTRNLHTTFRPRKKAAKEPELDKITPEDFMREIAKPSVRPVQALPDRHSRGALHIPGGVHEARSPAEYVLLKSWFPYPELYKADAQTIEAVLPHLDSPAKRLAFVKHLLRLPGVKPRIDHYNILLASHLSTTDGSANSLRELRKAMRENGVSETSETYHTVLRALAIHPDYLLRNTVLREMRESWIELLPEGRWSVAFGLLRDGQVERAVNEMERMMNQKSLYVPRWVYDLFAYRLTALGHFDEVVEILRARLDNHSDVIPLNVWYYLLDESSRAYHYQGTLFSWDRMVRTKGFIHPSDGLLLNVLNTAARHGDANLAIQAMERIASRSKIGHHHYEALIDCYAWAGNIPNALTVACIMDDAGVPCTAGSTRAILQCLCKAPHLLDSAIETLFDLGSKREVPLAAFNVVVEALCETGNYDKALALYRRVRQICHGGPSADTFSILFGGCERAQVAHFLAAEMAAFRIAATNSIFDRLAYAHALDGDLETAFRYLGQIDQPSLEPAKKRQWGPAALLPDNQALRRDTVRALIERCQRDGDKRAVQLLREVRFRRLPGLQDGEALPQPPIQREEIPVGRHINDGVAAIS
jgi:pentatricopeptide repeat protein